MKAVLTTLALALLTSGAISQFSVGVSIGGLAFHPQKQSTKNSDLYKWKLDQNGKFVGFASLTLLVSYEFNNYLGAKYIQTFVFHDCAGKFAGISHLGINLHDDIIGFQSKSDQFSISFGPFWYYRKNWSKENGYQNDPNFMILDEKKVWERKFVWHGGQIEYAYYFNNQNALSINFLPGYPYIYTFGVGAKHSYIRTD